MPHTPREEADKFLDLLVFLSSFAGAVIGMHNAGEITGLAEHLPGGKDAIDKVDDARKKALPFMLKYTVRKIIEDGPPAPDIRTNN
jgi:hypothetical protein